MGVFSKLALLPLAPVTGVIWLAEELERQAAEQLYGPGAVRAELEEVEGLYLRGDISEEERRGRESELLARLEGGYGGPVDSDGGEIRWFDGEEG